MYLGNSVASIKLAIKSEEFGKTNIAKDFRNSHSDSGSSSYSKKSRKCTVIRTDLLPADILSMLTEGEMFTINNILAQCADDDDKY